jgi:hypothetical protein
MNDAAPGSNRGARVQNAGPDERSSGEGRRAAADRFGEDTIAISPE